MPVSEYQRHQIFQWFEEHMGPERAASMMNLLPPVGWGDIASGTDLRNLEISLDAKVEKLDAKIDMVEARLVDEMAKLRHHLYWAVVGGNLTVGGLVLGATQLG